MELPGTIDKFAVVDVETANCDYASICQLGIVEFDLQGVVDEWSLLIDPEDEFDSFNIAIHGIEPKHVEGSLRFDQACADINLRLTRGLTFSYCWFDRSAICQAHGKYNVPMPTYNWVDATRIVRRTWPACARGGYKLKTVAKMLNIPMVRHHDALSDARTAGRIILEAVRHSQVTLGEWLTRIDQPITAPLSSASIAAGIDPLSIDANGPLHGECVVFTGAMSIPRREAMERVVRAGGEIGDNVTKNTTILVVGDQDPNRVGDTGKSSKQLKAEALILKGQETTLLSERSFFAALM